MHPDTALSIVHHRLQVLDQLRHELGDLVDADAPGELIGSCLTSILTNAQQLAHTADGLRLDLDPTTQP